MRLRQPAQVMVLFRRDLEDLARILLANKTTYSPANYIGTPPYARSDGGCTCANLGQHIRREEGIQELSSTRGPPHTILPGQTFYKGHLGGLPRGTDFSFPYAILTYSRKPKLMCTSLVLILTVVIDYSIDDTAAIAIEKFLLSAHGLTGR